MPLSRRQRWATNVALRGTARGAAFHRHDFVPRMRHEIMARASDKTNDMNSTMIYVIILANNIMKNPFWLDDTNGTPQLQNEKIS